MHGRILELEGIFIKGQFNLLTLQMWKVRTGEGDTLAKVTRLPPGALSLWVCYESVCPYSSFRDEKTELDPENQIRLISFILETWLSVEMALLCARN